MFKRVYEMYQSDCGIWSSKVGFASLVCSIGCIGLMQLPRGVKKKQNGQMFA